MKDDIEIIVITREQLAALIHDTIFAALAEFTAEQRPQPELVDGVTLCQMLSVSRATLHRLRVEGMPAIPVGDTYRYRPAACIAWLEQRGKRE